MGFQLHSNSKENKTSLRHRSFHAVLFANEIYCLSAHWLFLLRLVISYKELRILINKGSTLLALVLSSSLAWEEQLSMFL